MRYSVGQRVVQPILSELTFQVRDPERTESERQGARAATPSHYSLNSGASPFDAIRSNLMRLFEAAAASEGSEAYEASVATLGFGTDRLAYSRLRQLIDLPNDEGRRQFQEWVNRLPLENEYVVRDLVHEPRDPPSTANHVMIETVGENGQIVAAFVPHAKLVLQGNEKAIRGSAADVARRFPAYELRPTVESVVFTTFQKSPTIVFNQARTLDRMGKAEAAVPDALTTHEKGKPLVVPGVLTAAAIELIHAHDEAYEKYLELDSAEARILGRERLLRRLGSIMLTLFLSAGLLTYVTTHEPRIFQVRSRTLAFGILVLSMLLAAKLLYIKFPNLPQLAHAPCLAAAMTLAIAYPRRFAMGAMCVSALLAAITLGTDLAFTLPLLTGVSVSVYQLGEIRSRTKLISAGAVTAIIVMATSAALGLTQRGSFEAIRDQTLWSGISAMISAFVVSGLLPFIERTFRIATSLTLLEWRDPTRPLLQLLAREAPGTYNHSLVVGTLAEAACEAIGANSLLAQVGSLYHDIGKIHKASYFTENQEGRISRHEKLSPTMSLLIIIGHVKDGVEMAREYKLPRVLRQFIEEHHGTTVVRYFHHMAKEKQPKIASGRHDREVSESEFRYGGPKPRTRESAVVMMCDGVEGAVRSLSDPTVGRIEGMVNQIITDRLNDGQLDDCDITQKEIRKVADSLVKTLCSIYHGRLAYPRARKNVEAKKATEQRISVS